MALRWWGAVFVAMSAALLTLAAGIETKSVLDAQEAERALIAAGSMVAIVEPGTVADAISAKECAALDGVAGIRAAGPIWLLSPFQLATAPSRSITTVMGTTGALEAVAGAEAQRVQWSVAVSETLGDELGLVVGAPLPIRPAASWGRSASVSMISDLGSRRPSLSTALFANGLKAISSDECWIEFESWVDPSLIAASSGLLSGEIHQLRVRFPLPRNHLQRSGRSLLVDRPSRYAWIVTAVLMAVMQYFTVRSRRAEIALYRSFRTGRVGGLVIVWIGALVVAGVASGIAFAVSRFWGAGTIPDAYGVAQIVRAALLFLTLAWMISLLGLRRSPSQQLKE